MCLLIRLYWLKMKISLKTRKIIAREFLIIFSVYFLQLILVISFDTNQSFSNFLLVGLFWFGIIFLIRAVIWSIKTLRKKDEKKNG